MAATVSAAMPISPQIRVLRSPAADGDRQTNVTTNRRPIPNWLRSSAAANGDRQLKRVYPCLGSRLVAILGHPGGRPPLVTPKCVAWSLIRLRSSAIPRMAATDAAERRPVHPEVAIPGHPGGRPPRQVAVDSERADPYGSILRRLRPATATCPRSQPRTSGWRCCDPRPPRTTAASYVAGGYAYYLAQLRSPAAASGDGQ